MITWGLVSSATMFVSSAWSFYVLRFLLGVAEAGFFPGVIFYLTLWYPSPMRATRIAWFMAAVALAGVIGNPLSGMIIDRFSGALGLAGWQWLFLLEGVPSVITGIVVIFYLDSSVEEAAWLSAEEKRALAKELAAENADKPYHRLAHAFRSRLYGITFWLPTIIERFGATDYLQLGLLSAIPYATATVGMIAISRHSDQTSERRWHFIATVIVGALGLIGSGVFASSPATALVFLSIGTTGIIAALPLFWPIPTALLTGTAAAAGIGIINAVGNLGGYLGPNLPVWIGLVLSGPSAPLYGIAAVLVIGAVIIGVCTSPAD